MPDDIYDELPDEIRTKLRNLTNARRKCAVSMLDADAAGALKKPLTPEDIAFWKATLIDCDKELAELYHAQRP